MDHVCRCLKCGYVGLRRKSSPGLHTVRDCNGQMEFVNLTVDEYYVIAATKLKITRDNEEYYNFFRYMIELKENDLSKFNMEISEMRKQIDPKAELYPDFRKIRGPGHGSGRSGGCHPDGARRGDARTAQRGICGPRADRVPSPGAVRLSRRLCKEIFCHLRPGDCQ